MRTTISIDDAKVDELMRLNGAESRSDAIRQAVDEVIRRHKVAEFMSLAGNAPTAERVLVDTSVWVDFFRNRPAAVALVAELAPTHRAVISGTVLQETMQGAKTEKELGFLRAQMSLWHFEPEQPEDFAAAATLYARLRWLGVTV
eukprot:gene19910-24388_t